MLFNEKIGKSSQSGSSAVDQPVLGQPPRYGQKVELDLLSPRCSRKLIEGSAMRHSNYA